MYRFTNGRAYLDGKWKTGYDILVDNDRILDINSEVTYKDGQIIDVQGAYITP